MVTKKRELENGKERKKKKKAFSSGARNREGGSSRGPNKHCLLAKAAGGSVKATAVRGETGHAGGLKTGTPGTRGGLRHSRKIRQWVPS